LTKSPNLAEIYYQTIWNGSSLRFCVLLLMFIYLFYSDTRSPISLSWLPWNFATWSGLCSIL